MNYIRNKNDEIVGLYDHKKGSPYGLNGQVYKADKGNRIAEEVPELDIPNTTILDFKMKHEEVDSPVEKIKPVTSSKNNELRFSYVEYIARIQRDGLDTVNKYSKYGVEATTEAKSLVKKDFNYRILINPRDNSAQYVKIDKDLTFSEEELINYAFNIGHKSIRVISKYDMPNYKGKPKPKTSKDKYPGLDRGNMPDSYNPSDFTTKTNHLFDTPVSLAVFKSLVSSRITASEFEASIKNNTCLKNVMLSNTDNPLSLGVTTGNIVNNSIEIIGLTLGRVGGLSKTSTYNKLYLHSVNWRKVSSSHFTYLFRFKLISDKFTTQNFGSGPNIKKAFGRLFGAGEIELGLNYTRDGVGNPVDVAILRIGSSRYTIDMRDLEFYSINAKSLVANKPKKSKEIIKGSPVVISDDRRLKSFKKGDFVTVAAIMKDKSNFKNSQVKIKNGEKVETVLLKQVKYYDNQKKDDSKSKPTNKEGVQLSTEEISYTLPF